VRVGFVRRQRPYLAEKSKRDSSLLNPARRKGDAKESRVIALGMTGSVDGLVVADADLGFVGGVEEKQRRVAPPTLRFVACIPSAYALG
jgi:hypothetical protein